VRLLFTPVQHELGHVHFIHLDLIVSQHVRMRVQQALPILALAHCAHILQYHIQGNAPHGQECGPN
jgi:hypothetical protein